MLLTEQTQAENKKIEKYKNAGYTELKQAAWKKKKKEDPNGDFVNVGTYYYGYKKSATPKPKKDPAPTPAPAPNPKQDQPQTTTPKQDPQSDIPVDKTQTPDRSKDIPAYLECWAWEDENIFEDKFPGKESEKAKEFKKWLFNYTPKGNISAKYRNFANDYSGKYNNFCSPLTKDYEGKNELHKAPFIREMSLFEVTNMDGDRISLFDMWYDLTQKTTNESIIKKKLYEKLKTKTLKESVRNKILLTKENKDKKVNKISENLYKIAGYFYNERYDVFFNKYVRLKESYKKSKMFLMEGASDNFKNAFVRVFKGDEEELVRVAIPWFTSKLGLEGSVKAEVEEKLKNKYSGDDIANLFEDDWSDIVVSAIIKNAKTDVSEPTNAMDAVEKALISNMRSDFKEDLKNSIKNLISPIQDSRKTEIENLSTQLKNALLASKDGEESQEDTDSKVDDIFS